MTFPFNFKLEIETQNCDWGGGALPLAVVCGLHLQQSCVFVLSLMQKSVRVSVCSPAALQTRHVCEQGAGPAARSRRVGALGTLQRLLPVLWRRNPQHQSGLQQARVRKKEKKKSSTRQHLPVPGGLCWGLNGDVLNAGPGTGGGSAWVAG